MAINAEKMEEKRVRHHEWNSRILVEMERRNKENTLVDRWWRWH